MTLAVIPVYAGLLGLLLIILSARVILRRRSARVSMGDGEDKELRKRIRAQANFVEYVPLALILLVMAEIQGISAWVLHLLGAALLSGRILHPIGLGRTPQIMLLRRLGVGLTYLVIIVAATANIGPTIIG